MDYTPTDIAWLAGFLEAEGSFQISGQTKSYKGRSFAIYQAQVVATSVDRELLDRCERIAGGCVYKVGESRGNWRQAYRWSLKSTTLNDLLPALRPFLITKRRQADLLLELRSMTSRGAQAGAFGRRHDPQLDARRADIKLAVNALNHRGTSAPPEDQLAALRRVS